MNQNLNKSKRIYNKKDLIKQQINFYEFNINFMPKICIESVFVNEKSFINLHLDNTFSASMTDLFRFKKFKFSLYEIKSNIDLNSHSIHTLSDANLVPFLNKSLNFNEKFVQIPIQNRKLILIEVILIFFK